MSDINKLIEERPHLKDTLKLYEKVRRFIMTISDMNRKGIRCESVAYPSGLIDPMFESFSAIFDVPVDSLEPLKEAMKLGNIDLTRLPLNEIASFALPYHEEELEGILFLLSKPYFLGLKNSCDLDNIFWQEGKCTVCNSTPSLASVESSGKRQVYCSYCGTVGYYNRTTCPICFNDDAAKKNIFLADEEKGFSIHACDICSSYIKTIDSSLTDKFTYDLADIISLPLDIIAQGKGYRRLSPNPIGMTKMV